MENKFSRREILGLGIGAAALGAYGLAGAAPGKNASAGQHDTEAEAFSGKYKKYGDDIERILLLRSAPVAVKMLEKEEDIPEGAVRPRKAGYHLAQCQAFAMSRRDRVTVAMLKEDHWCPTAVMAYGLEKRPASMEKWTHPYDCFEQGRYIGMVTAPLQKADFDPDVVLVYAKPSQLRGLLLSAVKIEDVHDVKHHFFPPSCGWSVVNPMTDGNYRIVLPDPGEYQRALTEEGDLIFSIPVSRLDDMMSGLRQNEHGFFSYRDHQMFMEKDFELPGFYKDLFKSWGMDSE